MTAFKFAVSIVILLPAPVLVKTLRVLRLAEFMTFKLLLLIVSFKPTVKLVTSGDFSRSKTAGTLVVISEFLNIKFSIEVLSSFLAVLSPPSKSLNSRVSLPSPPFTLNIPTLALFILALKVSLPLPPFTSSKVVYPPTKSADRFAFKADASKFVVTPLGAALVPARAISRAASPFTTMFLLLTPLI